MLKLSNYYKEILKNIYNDVIIEYVISYHINNNSNFINFKILININDIPTTIEDLFKYHSKLKDIHDSYDNLKILIIINNDHKYSTHLKMEFIDYNI
jgi:hypothetical protein